MVTRHDTESLQGFSKAHIIAKDSMQMIAVKECKPIHTFLLIWTELCLDRNGYLEGFNFANIKHLSHELPLTIPALEQLFW